MDMRNMWRSIFLGVGRQDLSMLEIIGMMDGHDILETGIERSRNDIEYTREPPRQLFGQADGFHEEPSRWGLGGNLMPYRQFSRRNTYNEDYVVFKEVFEFE